MSASGEDQKLRHRIIQAESMRKLRQQRKQRMVTKYELPRRNESSIDDQSDSEGATASSCGNPNEPSPSKPTATIWKIEFEASPTMKRLHLYEVLAPMCEKLVVAFEQVNHLTTGCELSITASQRAVAVCLLADATTDEPTAHHQFAAALSGIIVDFNMTVVDSWCALVTHLTREDHDAEVKHVEWSELHLRYKLWWLITNERVRSSRSTNARLVSLLIGSSSVKTLLNSLLTEYRIQKNCNNPQRVDYKLCPSVSDADDEIVDKQPWAEQVLDWFAERLPEPDLNRRSLYLWGAAGVGKSRLISRLLAARMCLRRDCCEGFFLQDLAEEYEFVWLDEFVPEILSSRGEFRQQFNKLTGREQVLVRVKFDVQYEVDASNIRTIICSNHPPPVQDYFARRLYVVVAFTSMYGNDTVGEEPKKKKKKTKKPKQEGSDGMSSQDEHY
jgi:hypothetical protein